MFFIHLKTNARYFLAVKMLSNGEIADIVTTYTEVQT